MDIDPNEVAVWLMNLDGNGASDEEFAEFVATCYYIWKTDNPNYVLTKEDMQNLNTKELTDTLKETMDEIVFDKDIDSYCWWKQKEENEEDEETEEKNNENEEL